MELDENQLRAVTSNHNNICVIACPGAGKSRTLVERIKWLVSQGHDPSGFIVVTYTRMAARELTDRLDGIELGHCGTLHSLCFSLIQKHHERIGYPERIVIIDRDTEEALLAQSAEDVGYNGSHKKLAEAVKKCHVEHAMPKEIAAKAFLQRLRDSGTMTMDMILHYGLELLNMGVAVPATHLFVDEMQDASDIDAAIYEAFPARCKFFVGDPQQAIYGFRGGSPGNLIDLSLRSNFETIRLTQNYRSTIAVCQAANKLFAGDMVSVSGQPGAVKVFPFADEAEERAFLIANLHRIVGKKIAILCRTNALVASFTELLNINAMAVASKIRLPESWPMIKLSLELLQNPSNDMLAVRYLGLLNGDQEMANECLLQAQAEGVSLNDYAIKFTTPETMDELCDGFVKEEARLLNGIVDRYGCETIADILMAMEEIEFTAPTGDGVVVSTIHQNKGREYDIVFLPAMEQAVLPGRKTGAELDEERRIFYVALTRAREACYLSWCKTRQTTWGTVESGPSKFIQEIGL